MITWATEYWYLCLIALVIGVVTAAWIWARMGTGRDDALLDDGTATTTLPPPVPAPKLEPAKPTIDVAEPVAFTAPIAPVAAVAEPTGDRPAIAAAVGAPDDLTLIKGVGPKLNALLISLGVLRFDQIAAWTDADIAEVDRYLGNFSGRIVRDGWVEQAGYLATGNTAAFTAKYGQIGSENK